jgi:hypothetical protein
MDPRRVAILTLENQLTIELLDASRKIAADRWQVELVMRIDIPVAEHWFSSPQAQPAPLEKLVSALGQNTRFEYRDVRNFVADQEKTALFKSMSDNLLAMAPRYYSHPDFAARFIVKQYAAHQKKNYKAAL